MRIQTIAILYVSLVAGLVSNAQGIPVPTVFPQQPFTELKACRDFYQASVAPGSTNITDADTYCSYSTRIMSIENFCRGQVVFLGRNFQDCVLALNARASTAAVTTASTQVAADAQSAASAQQAQAQAAAAAAAAQRQQAEAQRQAQAQAQGQTAAGTSEAGNMNNIQLGLQAAAAFAPLLETRAPAATGSTVAPAVTDAINGNAAGGVVSVTPAGGGTAVVPAGGNVSTAVTGAIDQANANLTANGAPPSSLIPGGTTPVSVTPQGGDAGTVTVSDARAAADQLPEPLQQAGRSGVDATAASENATPPSTPEIGGAAEQAEVPLRNGEQSASQAGAAPAMVCFQQTRTQARTYYEKYQAYDRAKKTCVSTAEKAEFLCVEQSSPGAQAVRTLMNLATPVLAVVNSAQKACSSTANVTDFASKLLTVAKGLCVAAKIACDTSCTNSAKLLQEMRTIDGSLRTTYAGERTRCAAQAEAELGTGQATRDMASYTQIAERAFPVLQQFLQNESNPATQGTTPALVAKCESKMTDILLFGTGIAGLLAQKKSAKDCEKQLASDGSTGATVTQSQYCEKTENYQNQFCQCQRNPQQEGCPGFVMAPGAGNNGNDIAGTNIRGNAGLSNFAGGSKGLTAPGVGSITGGTDGNAAGESTFSGAAGSGNSEGQYPMVGAAGGGGTVAGNANTAEAAAKVKPEEKDKKKWDFGSFAGGVAGAFGLGKSKSSENGKLNNPQDEAIQRKVASEKLAGEISAASGKSNWEKVQDRYRIKSDTLLGQ